MNLWFKCDAQGQSRARERLPRARGRTVADNQVYRSLVRDLDRDDVAIPKGFASAARELA